MRYRLILKESNFEDTQTILSSLDPDDIRNTFTTDQLGDRQDSKELLFRYIYRVDNKPAGYIELYPLDVDPKNTAIVQYVVSTKYQRQGIGKKLLDIAVKWCLKHNYSKLEYYVRTSNIKSIGAGLKYGFKVFDKNTKWVYMRLNLSKMKLREDLGNTPKGYKDINKIMDYCNEWFENNPDKADKVIWKRYIQVRNWIRELKKYRSKFGPITFERKLDDIKLNKDKKGKDGYITLDKAILNAFKKWKLNKYNLEDLNRTIMYCLIELRAYRKKFKKQDFSCKL